MKYHTWYIDKGDYHEFTQKVPEQKDTVYSKRLCSKYVDCGDYYLVLWDEDCHYDDDILIINFEPDTSYKKKTDEQMRKLDSILNKKKK